MGKVLIACEESQAVCKAFRSIGNEAYSCDIQEPSGGHPEWHIMQDVIPLLNGRCSFKTMDGIEHSIDGKWDLIISHPPCTRLCNSGQRWLYWGDEEYRLKKKKEQEEAVDFFLKFTKADCPRIAIENPVCVMSTLYRKPDQIINPWQFGNPEQKKTCLWLKNLAILQETDNVYDYMMTLPKKLREKNYWMGRGHSKERSKTYPGIAKAMAEQWG